MTEFNNCFIIRSSSLFFKGISSGSEDLPFSRKSDCKKEKDVVSFLHGQNIICRQTKLADITHQQTIICRQLFADHVMGSRPMKGRKFAKNNNAHYLPCLSVHEHIFPLLSSEHMTVISNCTSGLLVQLISKTTKQIKNQFQDTDACNLRIW